MEKLKKIRTISPAIEAFSHEQAEEAKEVWNKSVPIFNDFIDAIASVKDEEAKILLLSQLKARKAAIEGLLVGFKYEFED